MQPQHTAATHDDDGQSTVVLSGGPSISATDSNQSDISDTSPTTGVAGLVNRIVSYATNKSQKKPTKSVAFAKNVPLPYQLTEKDLAVHNLMYRHNDELELMSRFIRVVEQGHEPHDTAAAAEDWALPPNDMSSIRSQFGASTRSRATHDSDYAVVEHPSEEDSMMFAVGIWADVPTTNYSPEDISAESLRS